MGKAYSWTRMKRENLEAIAKEGWNKEKLKQILQISGWNLAEELKRGLTEEEYNQRRYLNYSALKATIREARDVLGDDGFDLLVEGIKNGKQ